MKGGGHVCSLGIYPVGQKGYKVYDKATKEIHVSRDVIFFEERFPFKRGEIECSKGWEELQNMAWDDDMVGLTQHDQQHAWP